jgi:hypothetical protein
MSTATTTSTSNDTGQHTPTRGRQREAQQPVTQQARSAAQRLRTTMAAVDSPLQRMRISKWIRLGLTNAFQRIAVSVQKRLCLAVDVQRRRLIV